MFPTIGSSLLRKGCGLLRLVRMTRGGPQPCPQPGPAGASGFGMAQKTAADSCSWPADMVAEAFMPFYRCFSLCGACM